ncbi:MAG: peptide ABC transporter substrate-binding protein [Pirellulaceae bacterium]|nr:peptide ABC transporter substrate-binding protein [Pirellulaceae bacterium]
MTIESIATRLTQVTWFVAFAMTCALNLTANNASAQIINYAESGVPDPVGLELLQEEPHDIIYFTEKSGGGWAKVRLLTLPGRKMPVKPTGSLKFQVIDIEAKDLTAKWSEIEKIDFWETRLEREIKERIAKGDFVGAYPFLSVLIRDYPNRPGLRELRCDFLWNDAVARARKGSRGATLAMLEELRRYAPEYRRSQVLAAIGATTNQVLERLVKEGKLDLAQQILARLEKDYQEERLASIETWNAEFLNMAQAKRKEALDALEKKDYRAARTLARASVNLKPDIEGGDALVKEIDRIYPLVNVGVLQSATVFEPTRIDNWAARRSGRLLYRSLFEIKGAGPEGGEYDFIFGETDISPDRTVFDMYLETEKLGEPLNRVNAFFLADMLASRAQEDKENYFSPWAASVIGIGLDGPKHVECVLRRPHVLPECLLQVTVDGSWFGGEKGSPTGAYRRDVVEGNLTRYTLVEKPKVQTKPREIVEVRVDSAADAVSMLLKGEVDVLDQLFPADAIRLRRSKNVRVSNYPLPSLHMLVPCSEHPFVSNKTFRRGMLYGINREDILKGELLEQLDSPGCRVISGPFPAGLEMNDPLGYAYDQSIEPRRYEPSLAQLLLTVATNQMNTAAARKKQDPPKMTPVRLAYPADNLSRVACEAIRSQWMLIGLEVELVQLPVGRTYPEKDTADIVYIAAAVWEPIIDARRLLGPEGLAGSESQMVGLGLRRLEEAKNWKEVRDRLLDLHSITHHELPVLPLWQLVDSYAYRRQLVGVGNEIVSLYQNADNWRLD